MLKRKIDERKRDFLTASGGEVDGAGSASLPPRKRRRIGATTTRAAAARAAAAWPPTPIGEVPLSDGEKDKVLDARQLGVAALATRGDNKRLEEKLALQVPLSDGEKDKVLDARQLGVAVLATTEDNKRLEETLALQRKDV